MDASHSQRQQQQPSNGFGRIQPWVVVVMAFIVQVVAVVAFVLRIDSRVGFHEEQLMELRRQAGMENANFNALVNRLDRGETPLAKRVEGLDARVGVQNDRANTASFRLDQMSREIEIIRERQDRIVKALDSTYEKLQEHMRGDHNKQ